MDPTFISLLSGIAGGVLTKTFDGPLKSLEDIWYSSIGYKTDKLRKIAELKNHDAIEKYKIGITTETSKIPQEDLHEPELSIAGPALEASTYYVTDNSIRNMFEKLIASSMDSRKDGIARVSFVEIVKQLSPVDAIFLKEFSLQKNLAIILLQQTLKSGLHDTIKSNIVPNTFNIDSTLRPSLPSSIDNLQRLGIVQASYTEPKNIDYDKFFKKTPEYLNAQQLIEKENDRMQRTIDFQENVDKSLIPDDMARASVLNKHYPSKLNLIPGILRFTSFGKDFSSVCLN